MTDDTAPVASVTDHAPVLTMTLTGSGLASHLGWGEYEVTDVSLLSSGRYYLTLVRLDYEDDES